MAQHARQELSCLPFGPDEVGEIVSCIVEKSQGIFLWARFAVEEILATAHTLEGGHVALQAMPEEMSVFFRQILDGMSEMRVSNKKLAKAILQTTVCAARPLTTRELQQVLIPTFGRLASLEYTIRQVCPHLIKVDEETSLVQPIHETVREYLLDTSDSEFAVDRYKAHQYLATVCLELWTEEAFSGPISEHKRQQPQAATSMDEIHPLLKYAATTWFDHVQNALIDKKLEASVRHFLRTSVLSWIEAVGLLNDLSLLTMGALGLQAFVSQSPLISFADKKLISGWAVDMVRIGPKYGRNIVAYPASVHRLLPPFCPRGTRIGSQFGGAGDITVVGTGMKGWDDCLAHITVGDDGETCKAVVCSDAFLAVATSGSRGTVVIYDVETCQESSRISHGERIGAISIDALSDRLVTGGLRWVKVWDIKQGQVVAEQTNTTGSRSIALAFRPGGKVVLSFASDNTLTTWDLGRNVKQHIRWTRQSTENKYRGTPWGIGFNMSGGMISLAYKGWPIEVWDIERLELQATIPTRNGLGSCFNDSNGDIFGVDEDGCVVRFDAQSRTTTEMSLQSHIIACNPNGTLVATGNGEGVLRIFTADTLELLYTMDKYTESIRGLCFSPDGSKLYDIRSSDCNVWIPDALLVSVGEDSSTSGAESENSSFNRIPDSVRMEAARALVIVTAMADDTTGSYVCCGMSNGAVFVYDTQSGKRLQFLYNHASTVNVNTLTWSLDGHYIASGDDSGRVMVMRVEPVSASKWSCSTHLDFRLDQRLDGGARQIVLSPDSTCVLVLAQLSTRMYSLSDGQEIGERKPHNQGDGPCWLTHPSDPQRVICLTLELAKIFTWSCFTEIGSGKGIRLKHGKVSPWADKATQTRAFPTQDGSQLVLEVTAAERGGSAKCSFWDVSGLVEDAVEMSETGSLDHLQLDGVVGTYRERAVFLDRELWVCSTARGADDAEATRHFYVPMDWLNTSEERPSLMTRLGDFVYTKHGEVIVVKRGMKNRHGVV